MSFLPTLGLFQWIAILVVPPAIIALYFLKLKRVPLEVPSTYLWTRTIEDLHVNTIWQRLRQSLLLFLQLLIATLLILACLNFGWRGMQLQEDRLIFLLDTSASMNATDLGSGRTRLEVAKRRIGQMIDEMKSSHQAMLISFSDTAKVEQSFTDSRAALRYKLRNIKPTHRGSDIHEALTGAAGMANPGQTSFDPTEGENQSEDVAVAEAQSATLYVFSDGGFESAKNFDPGGHLAIQYIKIGDPEPNNVGIVSFTTERNPENPLETQAFARLENFGARNVKVSVALYQNDDDQETEAAEVEIDANGSTSVKFDLLDYETEQGETEQIDQATLRLVIEQEDDYMQDNMAYAAINAPRQARVLLISPLEDARLLALATEEASKVALVSSVVAQPNKPYDKKLPAGAYDLIIYDRCWPTQMPQANTFFIGAAPKLKTWTIGEKRVRPQIVDTDKAHPLMQLVELGNIVIADGSAVQGPLDPETKQPKEKPPGGVVLIEANVGPLLTIAPRDGFEDAVLGFEIFSTSEEGDTQINTNWHRRHSFPVFMKNVLEYLGGARGALAMLSAAPGKPVKLRSASPVKTLAVTRPDGGRSTAARDSQNTFIFSDTERPGIYAVRQGKAKQVSQHFAVNLFDTRESDIRPKDTIPVGFEDIAANRGWQAARQETWKWLLLVGLGVLLLEWYVFNRRVYL